MNFATSRRGVTIAALALVGLAVFQLWLSLTHAHGLEHAGNYDTAGYYVVARNFALGRGLTDTVLWNFLGDPSAVTRPAGDYWMVGWPVFLGGLMKLFGHSPRSAILICAVLSTLLPIAVFATAKAAGLSFGPAWLAGLSVCLQQRLFQTNVTPDMSLALQLAVLAAATGYLLLAARMTATRWQLMVTGAVVTLPFWIRGDGIAVLMATLLFHGARNFGRWKTAIRELGWLAAGSAVLQLPVHAYNLAAFGRLTPKPRATALWLTRYDELFYATAQPSHSSWAKQGWRALVTVREEVLSNAATQVLTQLPWLLGAMVVCGVAARAWRSAQGLAFLYWLIIVLLGFPALVVPVVTSADRITLVLCPLLTVACVAVSWHLLSAWRKEVRIAGMLIGLFLWARPFEPNSPHSSRGGTWRDAFSRARPEITEFAPHVTTHDSVVLTTEPWQVAMLLDVPAVIAPRDGVGGVRAVVERYHPLFVLAENRSELATELGQVEREAVPVARIGTFTWYRLPQR